MSDYLPNEVQCEILKRVPAKSLVVCTSVCKSWYSLITNPNFISSHFNHTLLLNQNDAQTLVLRPLGSRNINNKNPFVEEDETSLYKFSCLKIPFKIPFGDNYKVVGNCMGLVCLTNDDLNIILWNPSIRKFVEIGLTSMPESSCHRVVLGLGFCSTTSDHKIVKIEYPNKIFEKFSVRPQVEIYSFRSRTWKSVPCDLPPCGMVEILWSQVFLNGAIHWVANDKRVVESNCKIMSFDLVNEAFHEIELPNFTSDHSSDVFLAIYSGNLCVFEYRLLPTERCRIRVMTKYGVSDSWTTYIFCDLHQVKPLGLGKNGDILLKMKNKKNDEEFVLHNPCITFPRKSFGIVENMPSFYADTFMENLLLLNGQSQFGDERNQIHELLG